MAHQVRGLGVLLLLSPLHNPTGVYISVTSLQESYPLRLHSLSPALDDHSFLLSVQLPCSSRGLILPTRVTIHLTFVTIDNHPFSTTNLCWMLCIGL